MDNKDYYKILDVDKTADQKQIRDAYRKLALIYHPDRNSDNASAAEEMKKINEAYAVLSDPEKRQSYDSMRDQFGNGAYTQFRSNYTDQDIFNGSDIGRIFEELAKDFGFRNFDSVFKDFYGKAYKTYGIKKSGLAGRVFVFSSPFGRIKENIGTSPFRKGGQKLGRMFRSNRSCGEAAKGENLTDTISLSPEHARNGGPYAYLLKKTSKKLVVKIPPGVKEGQKIRLAGMGSEGKNGGSPGDLFLQVAIKKSIPERIKGIFKNIFEK